jgi:ribosomal protein S17E
MMIFEDEEKKSCMIKKDANSLGEKNKMNVSFLASDYSTNKTANEVAVSYSTNKIANDVANEVANKVSNKVANKVANDMANKVANDMANKDANDVANEVSNANNSREDETSEEEEIVEVSLDGLDTLNKTEILELKKPNQVYYKLYKAARKKAIKMREKAIEAFLEAKQIKTKYMLQDLDDSSDDSSLDESDEIE